ncbi:MAG: hypothetical protein LBK54_05575 [Propionibacteriaceae bacterium]|jgi:hypothetical protein|nr:hypothetical protein [Propionibacteriaceae bacterium]
MDTTGLIFLAVVGAWLFYLVPSQVSRRSRPSARAESQSTSPRTAPVHRGNPLGQDESDLDLELDLLTNPDLPVSSDLIRRARRRAIDRLSSRAARRRRLTLIGLLLLAGLAVGLAGAGLTSWWTPGMAGASLLIWIGLARWDVIRVNRRVERLNRLVEAANDEATVAITIAAQTDPADSADPPLQPSLPLWEPLSVPAQTYLSGPPAQRTVRTIDLASLPLPAARPVVTANDDETEQTDAQAV